MHLTHEKVLNQKTPLNLAQLLEIAFLNKLKKIFTPRKKKIQ